MTHASVKTPKQVLHTALLLFATGQGRGSPGPFARGATWHSPEAGESRLAGAGLRLAYGRPAAGRRPVTNAKGDSQSPDQDMIWAGQVQLTMSHFPDSAVIFHSFSV